MSPRVAARLSGHVRRRSLDCIRPVGLSSDGACGPEKTAAALQTQVRIGSLNIGNPSVMVIALVGCHFITEGSLLHRSVNSLGHGFRGNKTSPGKQREFKGCPDRRQAEAMAADADAEPPTSGMDLSTPRPADIGTTRPAPWPGFGTPMVLSLTPERFDLASNPPTATVPAGYTKNGKEAAQPLPPPWPLGWPPGLATRPPGRPVFDVPERTAEMLGDLEAAGLPYETPSVVADFHSLRESTSRIWWPRGPRSRRARSSPGIRPQASVVPRIAREPKG